MSKKVETIDLDVVNPEKPVNIMEKPITDNPPPKKEKEPFNGLDLSPIADEFKKLNKRLDDLVAAKEKPAEKPIVLPGQEPAIKEKPKQGKILDELDPFPEWEL